MPDAIFTHQRLAWVYDAFDGLDVRDAPDRPGREFVFITERTA